VAEDLNIVVVDNRSLDNSVAKIDVLDQKIEIIRLTTNLGYGSAANIGAQSADGKYILILNPDVELTKGALSRLERVLDQNEDIALVGPRLTYPDGGFYPSARSFPSYTTALAHAFLGIFWKNNLWSRRYRLEAEACNGESATAGAVDWVSGACFLVRKVAFDAVGGFDTGYFMYVEDLDLSWRLKQAGWKVFFEPDAVVVHDQGLSAKKHPFKMILAHHISTWRFSCRSSRGMSIFLLPFIGIALLVRMIIAIIKEFYTELTPKTSK
jgi:N-acetylglucosaminyl-diphospho-decaprenol L-rhamnosyltransferase